MATLSSNSKLTLVSSDKEIFEVEEIVAAESAFIKLMIEDLGVSKDNAIPISNVTGEILSKVLLYCKKHVDARKSADSTAADDELKTHDQAPNSADPTDQAPNSAPTDQAPNSADPTAASKSLADELKAFDAEFINVDQSILFDLVMAANYLNIKGLLDLTTQAIADMIKDKTPEEVRTIFNIENDVTPEEEAEIRRENQWAFE